MKKADAQKKKRTKKMKKGNHVTGDDGVRNADNIFDDGDDDEVNWKSRAETAEAACEAMKKDWALLNAFLNKTATQHSWCSEFEERLNTYNLSFAVLKLCGREDRARGHHPDQHLQLALRMVESRILAADGNWVPRAEYDKLRQQMASQTTVRRQLEGFGGGGGTPGGGGSLSAAVSGGPGFITMSRDEYESRMHRERQAAIEELQRRERRRAFIDPLTTVRTRDGDPF